MLSAASHWISFVAESRRPGRSIRASLREATISGTREGTMSAPLFPDDDGMIADPALATVSRNLFGISVVGIRCQTVMGATRVAAEATR
jgi:hypothetical protein